MNWATLESIATLRLMSVRQLAASMESAVTTTMISTVHAIQVGLASNAKLISTIVAAVEMLDSLKMIQVTTILDPVMTPEQQHVRMETPHTHVFVLLVLRVTTAQWISMNVRQYVVLMVVHVPIIFLVTLNASVQMDLQESAVK